MRGQHAELGQRNGESTAKKRIETIKDASIKYARLIGPGMLITVSYMDPGSYSTDLAAGASFQYKLLYVVFLSTVFAIFFQSLSIKLGSVTGLNLAQMIKLHTPWWLSAILYLVAEVAIIANDFGEVIGTAIALNLLFKLPILAGCAVSILDVLVILFLYRPQGSIKGLRAFEFSVFLAVLVVAMCFCIQLSLLKGTPVADVFKGYFPSKTLFRSEAIYQSCGIMGTTVMPHSLYLGSGTCQPRMLQYDKRHNKHKPRHTRSNTTDDPSTLSTFSTFSLPPILAPLHPCPKHYAPSLSAIRHCLRVSITEITISLATFALFVNSAVLVIAGSTLFNNDGDVDSPFLPDNDPDDPSLFHIHNLLSARLAPSAGTLFAISLLLSGTAAGIVCTIAGQMVCEAQLSWRVQPWVRRLVTRMITVAPAIVIAAAVGEEGLSRALEASQVVLCFCLPAVIGPLVWFTGRAAYCGVAIAPWMDDDRSQVKTVQFRNHWCTTAVAITIWLCIVCMNITTVVNVARGRVTIST
ncbi:natural resistance-associated macrophage protein-domain-containing protein [Elsinoe ampelina]|uniref:Natural resistance-associated macrophage protein-domain-containing protein n=1 Tax=Elsinoe ampelina TaxID=302913 RepID=A0A6A6GH12_9PEZI|nr:natural resistance-associated macrophage protein-domain-containing protein [Elsinoe ampelina]